MLKIRRFRDRLILNMVIPITVRYCLYIETVHRKKYRSLFKHIYQFWNPYQGYISWAFPTKLPSSEYHKISLMIGQNWFRQWLGALKLEPTTWINTVPVPWRRIVSLGFGLKFYWILFPRDQFTLNQRWFRQRLGAAWATHCFNQWWPSSLTHICDTRPQCVNKCHYLTWACK